MFGFTYEMSVFDRIRAYDMIAIKAEIFIASLSLIERCDSESTGKSSDPDIRELRRYR